MTPVAQSIQRLYFLPGDPYSTTRVGIDTFFLHNNLPINFSAHPRKT